MNVVWTSTGWADVERLYAFLAEHDIDAADAIFDALVDAPTELLTFPRRGSRLSEFDPREIREFRVGRYLLRYEVIGANVVVLRFFHVREDRF
ncbi:type II toxin-antitoxin system RelE/ParE family toxin [Sphingomonas sp. URHD0057]|uniref:type II toxin-antitoxin system RelE/ParE family toxin n=1 Tax=Sphingomonas sp. URHD0057 TaxID=1380389 RepID=UPI00048BA5BD|nr:type II toxin-antitoxin system RelE/ParE family toxin [Sphingomonas sp. URHD0057]